MAKKRKPPAWEAKLNSAMDAAIALHKKHPDEQVRIELGRSGASTGVVIPANFNPDDYVNPSPTKWDGLKIKPLPTA